MVLILCYKTYFFFSFVKVKYSSHAFRELIKRRQRSSIRSSVMVEPAHHCDHSPASEQQPPCLISGFIYGLARVSHDRDRSNVLSIACSITLYRGACTQVICTIDLQECVCIFKIKWAYINMVLYFIEVRHTCF